MAEHKKVALITGGARGIGLAAARRFLDEGWLVGLLDNDVDTLSVAVETLNRPDEVLKIDCNVSVPDQVAAAINAVSDRFGRLDALVNNAGIAIFKPLMETSFDDWTSVLATNLSGPFLMTQALAPLMLKSGGGSIVNITSISGFRASTLRVAYGTSKAGLKQLTRQMAAELGNLGIRVNAVAPGPVDTAMSKQVHTPAIRASYHDQIPLNRYGLEEEIANAIWFLSGPESSYINGQVLAVDGGFESTGIGLPTCEKMANYDAGRIGCSGRLRK